MEPRLLDRVFIPIASKNDARSTTRAAIPYLRESDGYAIVGHVIEKAGGAPDKASVEQREQHARDMFSVVRNEFAAADLGHECHILYGTDVAECIIRAADEHEADAIVFTPRAGSRWLKLLTGDVNLSLVTKADRPVIVLPDIKESETDG